MEGDLFHKLLCLRRCPDNARHLDSQVTRHSANVQTYADEKRQRRKYHKKVEDAHEKLNRPIGIKAPHRTG